MCITILFLVVLWSGGVSWWVFFAFQWGSTIGRHPKDVNSNIQHTTHAHPLHTGTSDLIFGFSPSSSAITNIAFFFYGFQPASQRHPNWCITSQNRSHIYVSHTDTKNPIQTIMAACWSSPLPVITSGVTGSGHRNLPVKWFSRKKNIQTAEIDVFIARIIIVDWR